MELLLVTVDDVPEPVAVVGDREAASALTVPVVLSVTVHVARTVPVASDLILNVPTDAPALDDERAQLRLFESDFQEFVPVPENDPLVGWK